MWIPSQKEMEAIASLNDNERTEYATKKIVDTRTVWLLRDDGGWKISAADNGLECIPIWPHAKYAEACSTGVWAGTHAASVDFQEFMAQWIEGMKHDGRSVAVFPVEARRAVVLPPATFAQMLEAELSKY